MFGSAASDGWLLNCTATGNSTGISSAQSVAVVYAFLTNCIVVSNIAASGSVTANYYNVTSTYSCLFPAAPGVGNISVDPQLLPDGIHLSASSPCRAMGTISDVVGTDIDGQLWENPPSMGVTNGTLNQSFLVNLGSRSAGFHLL